MQAVCVSADLSSFGVKFMFHGKREARFGKFVPSKQIDCLKLSRGDYLAVMVADELNGVIVGVQFVSAQGHRTKWATALHAAKFKMCSRLIQVVPAGQQIVGVDGFGKIETIKAPTALAARGAMRSMAMYASFVLVKQPKQHSGLVLNTMRVGLLSKVLKKESNDSLSILSLLTKGEELGTPSSVLRTMASRPSQYAQSLNDLIYHQPGNGMPSIAELFFAGGKTGSVARAVFAPRRDGGPRLADLVFEQKRGQRSIVQLVTDEELENNPALPSFLRAILSGDSALSPSPARLLMSRGNNSESSILERMLAHDDDAQHGSIARMVSVGEPSIARLFLTTTPRGKPSLARLSLPILQTLLARTGARESLIGLMMLEHSRKESLLRLMFKGNPGLLAIALRGEDMAVENSLCRLALTNPLVVDKGILTLGAPGDNGLTICEIGVAGDAEFGISVLRALALGEDTDNPSILRLLTWGGPDSCPLHVLFEGAFKAFIAGPSEQTPGWAWKEAMVVLQSLSALISGKNFGSVEEGYSSFLWDAARQMKSLGPEFEKEWALACARVSNEVARCARSAPEESLLRSLEGPLIEMLSACAMMEWIKAVIKLSLVINIVDKGKQGWLNKLVSWVTG